MTTWKKFRARNPEDPNEFLGVAEKGGRRAVHQKEFQRSKSRITFLAGGWGAGKSYAGLLFIEWCLFSNPGCLGIIIEPDYKKVRDFINNKFKVAFKDYIVGESVQDSIIFLEGRRRVLYMSGHRLEQMEQYQAAWLFADEVGLMKSDLLPRSTARVRDPWAQRRRIGYAGTPHWGWLVDAFDGRNDRDRRIIHASMFDNPMLDQDARDGMIDTCSGTMADAYLYGKFVPPGGTVYPEYEPAVHLVDWRYNPRYETGVSIDWGTRAPHVLFFQIIPKGYQLSTGRKTTHESAVIFDELIPDGSKTAIKTDALIDMIVERNYRLSRACVDPTGHAQIEISADRLQLPVNFIRRTRRVKVRVGVEHVSRMLRPHRGEPLLYFDRRLAESTSPRAICNAIRAYSYPQGVDGKPVSDEPLQDGVSEHAVDCMRYLAINYFPLVRYGRD